MVVTTLTSRIFFIVLLPSYIFGGNVLYNNISNVFLCKNTYSHFKKRTISLHFYLILNVKFVNSETSYILQLLLINNIL